MAGEDKSYKKQTTSQLNFLFELHSQGLTLEQHQIDLLVEHKYISVPKKVVNKDKKTFRQANQRIIEDTKSSADDFVKIIEEGEDSEYLMDENGRIVIMDEDAFDKFQQTTHFSYSTKKDITRKDWAPKSVIEHDIDFVNFVNSINNGFQKMSKYDKFRIYCQQATNWLEEKGSMSDCADHERRDYAYQEYARCKENTLYFMDKYLQLKEGDMENGSQAYASKPVHKVICFLIDSGYSLMMGKPRQIAATSTVGGIALKKILFNRNFFLKFIAQDKEKGIEIFDDKIKYPFTQLPEWMKPKVSNDRDNLLRFSKQGKSKGSKGGVNSKLQVVAPSVAAINGGSPQLVLVDEAGYIGILGKMLKEARPTMFVQNPITGKLEMRRQVVIWGTGGEMDKGGKAYEIEFLSTLAKWKEGEYGYGIVPLFFDYTTRPGISRAHYESERKAYAVEGPEKQSKAIQFRQHYPTTIADMFLTSSHLLVDPAWIEQQTNRINKIQHTIKPTRGYFEPIFDTSKPTDEHSDVPYEITGATFVPLDDSIIGADDKRVVVEVFTRPDNKYKNRFFQGTDPIMSNNGYSNMASVIWDRKYNNIAAIIDYREPDYKAVFLQVLLLGIYYAAQDEKCVKELVEINVGTAYVEYKSTKGFESQLVQRTELPDSLSSGANLYGIDKRGVRSKMIVSKLYEVFANHGEEFCLEKPFQQLRTFVCKVSENGTEVWATKDYKLFRDDVLDGLAFAYICETAYAHRPMINLVEDRKVKRFKYPLVRDKNGNLTRVKKVA